MKPISVQPALPAPIVSNPVKPGAVDRSETAFSNVLDQTLGKVNRLHNEADAAVRDLTTGSSGDIHQTMIAAEKASIAFEMLMQIRNKLISAYETVMRLSV